MIDEEAISEVEWKADSWNNQLLLMAFKSYSGKNYLDARKWMPQGRPEDGHYRRTGKGLMLEIEHWQAIIPKIQQLIASQKGS